MTATMVTTDEPRTTARSPVVQLRLLGGFELSIDATPIELQPALQRLMAFVALTPRGVGRMFAAFQLWPDKVEKRAMANLRSTIWRLNSLGVELIDVTPTRLALARGVWVDALCDPPGSDSDSAVDAAPAPFQTMLHDLLPDWYDDWLIVERERFRLLRLATLEASARASILAGDTTTAIQLALSALAIEGARETAHRLVIDAHLAEGNECEARREQARFERCLSA
jgi:DNA-binding SARP family transcriptional activator